MASIDSLQYADEWSDIGVMQVMSLVIVLFCHMATLAVLAGHRPSEDQIRRLEVAGDVPHSDWYFIATGLVSAVVISLPPDRLLKLFHNRSWRETMRDWERLDPKGFASVYDGTQCDAAHILNSSSGGAQQCAITVNYETLHVVLLILSWLHMVGGRVLFGKFAVAGSLSWAIYVIPRIVLGDLDASTKLPTSTRYPSSLLLAFVVAVLEIMLRRDFLAAQRAAVSYIDVSKRHDKVQEELDKTLTPLKMRRDRQMLKLASPMERVLDLLYGLRESGLLRDEEAQEQLQDVLAILEKAQDAARRRGVTAPCGRSTSTRSSQAGERGRRRDGLAQKANFLEWTGSASAVNLVGTPKTASIKTSPGTPPPSREPPSRTLVDNLQTSALRCCRRAGQVADAPPPALPGAVAAARPARPSARARIEDRQGEAKRLHLRDGAELRQQPVPQRAARGGRPARDAQLSAPLVEVHLAATDDRRALRGGGARLYAPGHEQRVRVEGRLGAHHPLPRRVAAREPPSRVGVLAPHATQLCLQVVARQLRRVPQARDEARPHDRSQAAL